MTPLPWRAWGFSCPGWRVQQNHHRQFQIAWLPGTGAFLPLPKLDNSKETKVTWVDQTLREEPFHSISSTVIYQALWGKTTIWFLHSWSWSNIDGEKVTFIHSPIHWTNIQDKVSCDLYMLNPFFSSQSSCYSVWLWNLTQLISPWTLCSHGFQDHSCSDSPPTSLATQNGFFSDSHSETSTL